MLHSFGSLVLVLTHLHPLCATVSSCSNDGKCSRDADNLLPITLGAKPPDDRYRLLRDGELPILLWWYGDVFPHLKTPKSHEIKCSLGSCITSVDRSLQNNDSTRAFIFYGTSFLANDLPLPRKAFHHWALFHEESPKNNWIFSHQPGIQVFNYTATFRRESDYPLSSQFIVDPNDWGNQKFFKTTEQKNRYQREEGLAPVVYLQRDCDPPSDRDTFVRELMKYIPIDSYGPCLNNKELPHNIQGFIKLHDESFYEFMSKYKFHLSLENAICQDYMTEKLFRPIEIGVVPVYKGSPNVTDFMPTDKAVILVDDFDNPKSLADFLRNLNRDDKKYEEYLEHVKLGATNPYLLNHLEIRKWKIRDKWDKINFGHRMYASWECYVCDQIHQWDGDIRKHNKDPKIPLPKLRYGQVSHMGCPEPLPFKWNRSKNISLNYWEGFHEGVALNLMLQRGESDPSQFLSKYLRMKTDKYPT